MQCCAAPQHMRVRMDEVFAPHVPASVVEEMEAAGKHLVEVVEAAHQEAAVTEALRRHYEARARVAAARAEAAHVLVL